MRDAARLARYGGVKELRESPPHAIQQLFFYAASLDSEPRDITPVLVDVSPSEVMTAWRAAMAAHESQTSARDYVDNGVADAEQVDYAIPLFPSDPIVVDSLATIGRGARGF